MRARDVATHSAETRTADEGISHKHFDLPPWLGSMPRALRPPAARSQAAQILRNSAPRQSLSDLLSLPEISTPDFLNASLFLCRLLQRHLISIRSSWRCILSDAVVGSRLCGLRGFYCGYHGLRGLAIQSCRQRRGQTRSW